MFYCFSPDWFCYEKYVSVESDKESTTIFQNSAVDSVSIKMCGFLQFRIQRPSAPMLK